jgi:hypothetical protein
MNLQLGPTPSQATCNALKDVRVPENPRPDKAVDALGVSSDRQRRETEKSVDMCDDYFVHSKSFHRRQNVCAERSAFRLRRCFGTLTFSQREQKHHRAYTVERRLAENTMHVD